MFATILKVFMEEYFQIMNQPAYDLRQEAACYS
jgi:hypothetical protein